MGKMDAVECPMLRGNRKYCPGLTPRDQGELRVVVEVVANEGTRARFLDASRNLLSGVTSE